jgi:ATP-dependent DNA ligase
MLPAGFIAPCLPSKTDRLPSGGQWLHEIKHDGFRIIARKTGAQVRLYSRPGNDLTRRFPLIVETLARLRSRSCIVDGEAVACDDNGVASFDLVRHQRANGSVFLYAFDLVELNGDDLRRDPLEVRKATLARVAGQGWRRPAVQRAYRERWPDPFFAHLPTSSVSKVLSRSRRTRPTVPAARRTGSK